MNKKSELIVKDEQSHPIALRPDPYMGLIQVAIEKDIDIIKLEKLMDLQDRHDAKNARKSFFAALSGFQSDIPIIEKTGLASFKHKTGTGKTEYDYGKLEDIAKAIRPHLVIHGLSYRYEMGNEGGLLKIICIVSHTEGHEERTEMQSFADNSGSKNGIQQIASTHSYMKRYTLTAALGIVVGGEDNDGADYQGPNSEDNNSNHENGDQNIYPDKAFDGVFPAWEKQILNGKKTAEQLIERGNNQNITFSENQLKKLRNVRKA